LKRVPSKSFLEHVFLTDTMLGGVTGFKQTVAWDLRKKKLAGGARLQGGRNMTYIGSPSARMWPLSGSQAVFVRKVAGELRVKSDMDFSKGRMMDLDAPNVLAPGSERRIWYIASNGKDHRFQAYTIPVDLVDTVQAPGFE
jgi:hypothetical protein